MWHFVTGIMMKNFKRHRDSIESVRLTEDGKWLASAGNSIVNIWKSKK